MEVCVANKKVRLFERGELVLLVVLGAGIEPARPLLATGF